jgi:hypothetical protein
VVVHPRRPSRLRRRRSDVGGDELGTSLAVGVDSDLRAVIMTVEAGTAGSDDVCAGEADELDGVGGAVLGLEVRAIETDADLLAHEVGAEAVAEGALDDEHVGAVDARGCQLAVGGLVDTGGVDDLA